ncbi:DUF2235 domain-containing protein [Gordonia sp. NPDC003424]
MSKNIVYCSDGTWNGPSTRTNVSRLYDSLVDDHDSQRALYDPGVGSSGGLLGKMLGGAFGDGLVENVREGYARIAACYEPGDRIFLFGFSRGAYTARSLGGMIAYCGLPAHGSTDQLVATAYAAYRGRVNGVRWAARPAELIDAHVEMIGVWDTVGTLGVPGALFGHQDAEKYGFLDTALHRDVRAGYHALSIDEKRRQFTPTLWDAPAPGQVIEQVWFAGVHCDVGGGGRARKTSLSEITLGWMMTKARDHGVQLTPNAAYPHLLMPPLSAGVPMRTSWRPYWGWPVERTIPAHATIANSVAARVTENRHYRPKRLIDPITRRLATTFPLAAVVDMA